MAHGKLVLPTEQHIQENSHEIGKGIVVGVFASRNSKEWKRISEKKKREKNRQHHTDSEIDQAIRQYGEGSVKILYDSNP